MKEIKVPILNNEYFVIVCWGKSEDVEKLLEDNKHDEGQRAHAVNCFRDAEGICFTTAACDPVIALPHAPKTPAEIGTLSHEAVHAVEDIFTQIKQPLGGEIFAYSVGAVVREVLKVVK